MALSRHPIAPMLAAGVVGNSAIYLIPLLVGAIVGARGFTEQQAGLMASADLAGYAEATVVSALVLRRFRWPRIALTGACIMIVANLLTPLIHGLGAFAAIRFVSGSGGGLLAAIATVSLGETANPDRNFGLFFAACLLFATAGLWGLPPVLEHFGLDGAYWLIAGLALLVGFTTSSLPQGHISRAGADDENVRRSWLPAALVLLAILVFFTEQNAVWAFAERIGNSAGLSVGYIGFSLGVATLTGFVGSAIVAWSGARFGRLVPLIVVTVLQIGCFVALAGPKTPTIYLAAVAVLGLAWNIANPFQLGILANVDIGGRALALAATVTGIGLAAGPAVAAMAIDHGYAGLLGLSGLLAMVSLLLVLPALRAVRARGAAEAS